MFYILILTTVIQISKLKQQSMIDCKIRPEPSTNLTSVEYKSFIKPYFVLKEHITFKLV